VPSGEATHTNFIIFGLPRLGLEPTCYRTRGEHASNYTTDAFKSGQQLKYDLTLFKEVSFDIVPVVGDPSDESVAFLKSLDRPLVDEESIIQLFA